MYKQISKSEFIDSFDAAGREEQFSYDALVALYDYYTEMEEDIGQEIELDVVAICCEWSEEDLSCVLDSYNLEDLEELQENTTAFVISDDVVLYIAY